MDSYNVPGKTFIVLVVLSQVIGVTCLGLTIAWLAMYWGGFDWGDKHKLFNYHPLFMVLGMVFLYGDAILAYRVFRNQKKLPIKILHGCMHIFALIFSIVGLKAVFDFHNQNNIPNMYSLHSWLGVATVGLFCLQWVGGLVAFLCPQVPPSIRAKLLPKHVSVGIGLFLLAIAVCVIGITEKNFFSQRYSSLLPAEQMGNILGLFLVCFGAIVFYLLHNSDYRRVEIDYAEHQALNQ